jgi:hypothetical protein
VSWASLFERAGDSAPSLSEIHETVTRRRAAVSDTATEPSSSEDVSAERDSSPARIVADADVLAADLIVGEAAREALDHLRAHSWLVLVASDQLLDDAEAVIAALDGATLASDWRDHIESDCDRVAHPAGDHPALASAARGGAMHVISLDEELQSANAGVAIRARVETSVKDPRAFATLFEPEPVYEAVEDGEYPGPDRDPRA